MLQKQYTYQQASFWYVLSLVTSVVNDSMTKYISSCDFSPQQITFYRVIIGLLLLIIYIFIYSPSAFRTKHISIHIVRGGIFFVASFLWSYGLGKTAVASATTISFTLPLFTLFFARILLKEKVNKNLWLATLIGFVATTMIIFDTTSLTTPPNSWHINQSLLAFLIAALLFSLLDIINKKYIGKESMLSMLFYSNLMASLLGMPFVSTNVFLLSFNQAILLLLLSIGGLAILFFLLKAYTYAPISSLAPLRYLELLIACFIDFICFNHLPKPYFLLGSSILITTSLFVISRHKNI